MKKNLFLVTVLMLSLTPLISQVTTTTLNTVSDFSDFTISGTPNISSHFTVSPAVQGTSPLTFTLALGSGNPSYKEVSNTYTSTIMFDSIIAKFDILSYGYKYNNVYEPGNSTKVIRTLNTNSISVTFSLSSYSGIIYTTTVSNLSVIGYKNGSSTGIKESLDLTKTNVWVNANKIYFKNLDNKELKMNVFNMSGQLVMEDNHPKPETELYLPKGAYFITLTDTNKNKLLTKKIIIE